MTESQTKEALQSALMDMDQQIANLKMALRMSPREAEDLGYSSQSTTTRNDLLSQLEVLTKRRHELDTALHAKSRGRCTVCGGLISEARLTARPESVTCIACAEAREAGSYPVVRRRVPRLTAYS